MGASIVHKPSKVVAELGHWNAYAVTSAKRGKAHTIPFFHVCQPLDILWLQWWCIHARSLCLKTSRWSSTKDTLQTVRMGGGMLRFLCSGCFLLANIPPLQSVLLINLRVVIAHTCLWWLYMYVHSWSVLMMFIYAYLHNPCPKASDVAVFNLLSVILQTHAADILLQILEELIS